MRRTLFLLAALSLAASPAIAQERLATTGRGSDLTFRAEKPFARVVMPNTVDQVWRMLPDAYKLLGFDVKAARDTARKEMLTSFMQIRGQLYPGEPNSQYFECSRSSASGPLADQGEITFAMLSRIETDARGGTAVLTQVDARVKRRDSSQFPIECISTGRLEQMLAAFLQQRLNTGGDVEIRRGSR